MDNERILKFHETASAHYLRGEYREAVDAWKALLALDPLDAQAIEGMRLAEAFCRRSEDTEAALEAERGEGVARLRRDIDAIDAHLEAGEEAAAVALAERLASEAPGNPDVLEALERARAAQAEVALDRGLSVLDSLSAGIDGVQSPRTPAAAGAPAPADAPEAALDVAPQQRVGL